MNIELPCLTRFGEERISEIKIHGLKIKRASKRNRVAKDVYCFGLTTPKYALRFAKNTRATFVTNQRQQLHQQWFAHSIFPNSKPLTWIYSDSSLVPYDTDYLCSHLGFGLRTSIDKCFACVTSDKGNWVQSSNIHKNLHVQENEKPL